MKKFIPVIIAIVLILLVGAVALGSKILEKYSYSKERADLNVYYNVIDDSEAAIVLQDEMVTEKAKIIQGIYYLDFSTLQKYLNERFYIDSNEQLLLYSNPTDVITVPIEGMTYFYSVSGEVGECPYPIATYQGDTLYVAMDYIKLFTNFSYEAFTEPNRIQIYNQWNPMTVADIKKDTAIRYQGGIKSDILQDVTVGEKVTVLETLENWSKVKTTQSIIGYVENKRLTDSREETGTPVTDYIQPEYTSMTKEGKISLGWHQVTNMSANSYIEDVLANTKALNVISPTWFQLSDNEGGFNSLASQDYVNAAHSKGMEVWALVDDFTNEVDTKQILSYTTKRKKLVDGLIQTVLQYQIDGINIDFEKISEKAGEDFTQFIRELSIACRKNQIVLSIDNYVPRDHSTHYNRKEQGVVADYVIIMGYDEHYAGGNVAGSVASIDFVEDGIVRTLEEVPSNKVINAIPFYTRIWATQEGNVKADSVGMGAADNFVANNGIIPVWDEITCQNYGEVQIDNTLYQVWLEDERSVEVKLNVMDKYKIAGVAGWKLGLEKPSIWDLIANYVTG